MEWLSNVTNQMDSFGLMANDIGLDSCHLEAVDESHNENRDWSGAIKDWHLASEAEMPPKILPRPLHSVRIRKKKIFQILLFFIKLDYLGPSRVFVACRTSRRLTQFEICNLNMFFFKFWSNIYVLFLEAPPFLIGPKFCWLQFIKGEQKPNDQNWCVLFVLVCNLKIE